MIKVELNKLSQGQKNTLENQQVIQNNKRNRGEEVL